MNPLIINNFIQTYGSYLLNCVDFPYTFTSHITFQKKNLFISTKL